MIGRDVRHAARSGALTSTTAGLAPGFAQGNLVVLPVDVADDFARFCRLNPKPCPVIGMTEPGMPAVPELGSDVDLRTDLPRYRVWRDGELVEEVADISHLWRDDLVGFVLGCSFTFEDALIAAGIPLKHLAAGTNVAMYRTNIACEPAGPFTGPLVVSMRPLSASDAAQAIEITARFPSAHGAPVHVGKPEAIGISNNLNARLRRPGRDLAGRAPGLLGLRRDSTSRHRQRAHPLCRYPCAGMHARNRSGREPSLSPAERRVLRLRSC